MKPLATLRDHLCFLWPKLLGISKIYPGVFNSMFKAASSGNDMSAICGDNFPIMVRLTVDEFYDTIGMPGQGIQLEEGVKMAVAL